MGLAADSGWLTMIAAIIHGQSGFLLCLAGPRPYSRAVLQLLATPRSRHTVLLPNLLKSPEHFNSVQSSWTPSIPWATWTLFVCLFGFVLFFFSFSFLRQGFLCAALAVILELTL